MSTKDEQRRATLTVEEAGRELGISRSTAWRLVWAGRLPTLRLGHRVVVPRVQLDALLAGEGGDANERP